ncbi:MAG: MBL fold metallo-hydrolase [Burkholderiales bacterium]|nr:MBL fold metallo-hydrolase [Burkholderiales bacterium]
MTAGWIRTALLALLALPAAAQDFSKVEIRTTKLGDTTYLMEGAGGNLGLSIGEDAVFLIDDQFAPLSERITAAIAKLTSKPVRFVLNTHWHVDHTGGNENFGKAGAVLIAHENVRKRMSSEQFIEFVQSRQAPFPKAALPVVTFAQSVTFHLNGDEMRVMHVPRAHTDGDAIVHLVKSDVIHMGDIYWNGLYPFIDTSSGGTVDGVIAGCDQALAIAGDATRIIPGHGPGLSNKAELKAYRDMLATVAARVKKLVAEGRKVDEIKAAKVSAEYDEKWGKAFIKPDRFAEMLTLDILKGR